MNAFKMMDDEILDRFLNNAVEKAKREIDESGKLSIENAIPLMLKSQYNHIRHLEAEMVTKTEFNERFNLLEKKFNEKFNLLETEFNEKLNLLEEKFNEKFNLLDEKFNLLKEDFHSLKGDFHSLKSAFWWGLSIAVAFLTAVITILTLFGK